LKPLLLDFLSCAITMGFFVAGLFFLRSWKQSRDCLFIAFALAFWMLGAGAGDMNKDEESRFAKAIAAFAGGDKSRPMVFFCVDSECWLSYNAALRAIKLGYTNVMWYRGGIASWRIGQNAMAQSDPFFW